ncbi:MAG: hypothetical protein LBT20_03895 [Clostridiales bacterium]|jgi:hypothetical protein|nr:hypothetical protein [Clostridiales bacterium]
MKRTVSKKTKFWAIILMIVALSVLLTSCLEDISDTKEETPQPTYEEQLAAKLEEYGYANAYLTHEGEILHAPFQSLTLNNVFLTFYIPNSFTNNHVLAIAEACNEINLSSSKVFFRYERVSSIPTNAFSFYLINDVAPYDGRFYSNAVNDYTGVSKGYGIKSGTIYLKDEHCYISKDHLQSVVLHEMLHALGLKDYEKEDSAVKDWSIMYHEPDRYSYTSIQDFDLENIVWYYGQ